MFYCVVKPRIDRDAMKSVTIKAGRTLQWAVDVEGEPTPNIEWVWRDGVPLQDSGRIKIDNSKPNHTVFTITDAKREDRGKYTLK
jgi:Immunoglobulin I-set domain